jgi:hypothetical protein
MAEALLALVFEINLCGVFYDLVSGVYGDGYHFNTCVRYANGIPFQYDGMGRTRNFAPSEISFPARLPLGMCIATVVYCKRI